MNEIVYWSAKQLAEAICTKELSSLEVVEAHLRRIQEVNPKLNAVVQLTAETARTQARQADADLARGELKSLLHLSRTAFAGLKVGGRPWLRPREALS